MKKITIALALLLGLTGTASALEITNVDCNKNSGLVTVTYSASAWDVLYHKHILIKGIGSDGVWRTATHPMNWTQFTTFDQTSYMFNETALTDIKNWNVATDKALISIGQCS